MRSHKLLSTVFRQALLAVCIVFVGALTMTALSPEAHAAFYFNQNNPASGQNKHATKHSRPAKHSRHHRANTTVVAPTPVPVVPAPAPVPPVAVTPPPVPPVAATPTQVPARPAKHSRHHRANTTVVAPTPIPPVATTPTPAPVVPAPAPVPPVATTPTPAPVVPAPAPVPPVATTPTPVPVVPAPAPVPPVATTPTPAPVVPAPAPVPPVDTTPAPAPVVPAPAPVPPVDTTPAPVPVVPAPTPVPPVDTTPAPVPVVPAPTPAPTPAPAPAPKPVVTTPPPAPPTVTLICGQMAPAVTSSVSVKDTGAKGDGVTNDTAAIQAAIDKVAGTGGTVVVPPGTYMIDALSSLKLKSNMTFKGTVGTSILQVITNGSESYSTITIQNATNVNVYGITLEGDRATHTGTTGAWGMGVSILDSTNVFIQDVLSKDNWGDGFYQGGGDLQSSNIKLCGVSGLNNRRQGLSITNVDGMLVDTSTFGNTNGTAPQSGIDMEPDPGESVNNVTISNSWFISNVGYGVITWAVNGPVSNITITKNNFYGNGSTIYIDPATTNVIVTGNITPQKAAVVATPTPVSPMIPSLTPPSGVSAPTTVPTAPLLTATASCNTPPPAPTSSLVVSVKDTGATGNGSTDDTAAIQAAINQVGGTGGTVFVPAGTYLVSISNAWPYPALALKSNMTFKMASGATIKLAPNASGNYAVLFINNVSNVNVIGGTLLGDRHQHLTPGDDALTAVGDGCPNDPCYGQWGYGIGIISGTSIFIQGVTSNQMWGDGFDADYASNNVAFCGVVADDDRRQGISITGGNNILVSDSVFSNTKGHWPMAGIDLEPYANQTVSNVTIKNNKFINNYGGEIDLVAGTYLTDSNQVINTTIDGNSILGLAPSINVGGATGGRITNNTLSSDSTGINIDSNGFPVTGFTVTGNTIKAPVCISGGAGNNISGNTCN
jgi:polygalacturonase